jgi:wyosine [tRNA(Phe)-imidazoG37] synthetase (radical SAM superfamily)
MLSSIKTCNDLHVGEILYHYEDNIAPNIEEIWTKRKQIIEDCKRGIFPKNCQTCPNLEEAEWDDDIRIKKLSLFHWLHCNCDCEYCFQRKYKNGFSDEIKQSEYYEALPIIKDMLKSNKIAEKEAFEIEFGGGEVTILKEFSELAKLIMEHGFYYCYVMSSGILYSEVIQEMINKGDTKFSVTISAGNRETFKKIKNRDKFDIVKTNLEKYIEKAEHKENICIRYIIDEGYNDSEKDIQDWLDFCKEIKAENIEICIDFCRGFEEKRGKKYSLEIEKLIKYYQEEAPKTGIKRIYIDKTSQDILDRGHY